MGKGPSAAGEPPLLPGVAAGQAGRFSFVPWQVTRAYRSMLLTSIETQKGGPARNLLSHLILGIEKRTSAETLMSVNPSAHKSRYIQLSGFTQGKAPAEPGTHHDSSLCHFILLSFPVFCP